MKLYGIDIENESENDEDYIPDKDELIKEEKQIIHESAQNIQQIYSEMKNIDLYQPKICTKSAAEIAKEVYNSFNKIETKRIKFAGKSFIINDKGEIIEENQEQNQQKVQKSIGNSLTLKELKESFKYYREVIKKMTNRAKTINSITKSKLDWKQYTTKEKIEQQMEQKRKSGQGVLEKAKFLSRTNERVKQVRYNKNNTLQ